jgi:hypothetical protein
MVRSHRVQAAISLILNGTGKLRTMEIQGGAEMQQCAAFSSEALNDNDINFQHKGADTWR